MDRNALLYTHHDVWQRQPNVMAPLRQWLTGHHSLTARLKNHYDDFAVKLLTADYDEPNQDERLLLNIRAKQLAHIREVLLLGGEKPLVFAHTVISMHAVQRGWARFLQQGNRPLGETLFANPKIKRSRLSYQLIKANHPLYQALQLSLRTHGYRTEGKPLWARRSLFCASRTVTGDYSKPMEMLVTEIFLSALA